MTVRKRSPMTWLLLAALAITATFTAFHVIRTTHDYVYFKVHADEPIKPWMTIGFIAHSYHLPPHVLLGALDLPLQPHDHRPLRRIARAKGVSFAVVKARLEMAIVHSRPPYPPPAPPPPLPPALNR